jgi:hypothetical protein
MGQIVSQSHASRTALRRELEAIVERTLALLDELDGDADLEPGLGWSRTYATTRFDASPWSVDLEEGDSPEPRLIHRQARRVRPLPVALP